MFRCRIDITSLIEFTDSYHNPYSNYLYIKGIYVATVYLLWLFLLYV